MAIFNDLAIELQEAIWEMVLPASRGIHWIEVEGIPQEAAFVRDSIRMTKWYNFDRVPETYWDVYYSRDLNHDFSGRASESKRESSPFFRYLLTTVPAAVGKSESAGNTDVLANEVAYTSRCRQLSTYYQIATLLSLCRLCRMIALRYIRTNRNCSWPIRRSMGPLYRPRPMDVWETQYSSDAGPPVSLLHTSWKLLRPRIHTLDLVVLRLHDRQGRASSLLKHAPWQYVIEKPEHESTFACFDRVGLEWHPSWGTVGGRGELRVGNIRAFIKTMQGSHSPTALYWLVDGVPRPNWERDYPAVVQKVFADRLAIEKSNLAEHLSLHWKLGESEREALLADHHIDLEFEANGRRYYLVFVAFGEFHRDEKAQLDHAGVGCSGPFPGTAAMWPQALREPVRLAHDICRAWRENVGTLASFSYILSWEPVS
ncbi:hypothetical protein OPT61_g923 [Boeremia exigua]|uniref:Uncharacterized protein n=1 Tax=Boeremia exigua TaxID=749465 RepID=A0ACC2IS19_9PLEO|nr:hypothetical protein OPT61_g923 [Boeremia exigua]